MIQNHLSQHDEKGAVIPQLLKKSLYVDDFAGGADNDQEALDIYEKSQDVMKKGGFVLRKWNSNSKILPDRIAKDTLSNGTQTTSSSVVESEREIDSKQHSKEITPVNILGSSWNVKGIQQYIFLLFHLEELLK